MMHLEVSVGALSWLQDAIYLEGHGDLVSRVLNRVTIWVIVIGVTNLLVRLQVLTAHCSSTTVMSCLTGQDDLLGLSGEYGNTICRAYIGILFPYSPLRTTKTGNDEGLGPQKSAQKPSPFSARIWQRCH